MFKVKYCLLVILIAVLASGCGNGATQKASQVAAKVNQDEISVHQINFQLSRLGNVPQEKSKEVADQILNKLIDQQLLKEQAIAEKLDRDPKVLQFLEASKDEILAQAYLEKLASKASNPTSAQIDEFYSKNPALFAQRRIFRIQELIVTAPQEKHAEIQAVVSGKKNITEVADWLRAQTYPITANTNVRTAEQLPLELLKKLQPMSDGQLLVVEGPQSVNIFHLIGSQAAPITKENAKPMIERYFLNIAKTDLVKKQMADLHSRAKIEYMGAFAQLADSKAEKIKKSEPSATPAKSEDDKKPVPATPELGTSESSTIDRGLAGL